MMFGSIKNLIIVAVGATMLTKIVADDLQIDVLVAVPESECIAATAGDKIKVHYAGSLEDGTEFDSSYNRGTPISFQLGAGQVIAGWDQGLEGCCIGEKRKLTIPPNLAYGDRGIGPIPGGATLTFIAELVDIEGSKSPRDEL
ncbi:FK506-binding protein 2 [[Candida] railenensis]|uniref:peptidylprolyl isomerase n=1 Tax=[Candida] railenensis TaxID=45579 RepID=A0A9P0QTL3_9ASCO|nr:FK506-binding protein 2 [[Candida] railenensis]